MADVGERAGKESASGVAITSENGRFLGRREETAGHGLGLSAEGRVGGVCGGGGAVGYGKVDFRLVSHERQLHFAGRSGWILIDGIGVEVGVIVVASVVQGLDVEVCGEGARDGGSGL